MGYVTTLARPWLVLDIETAAIEDIDQYADDVRIDSRLRDAEKIAEAKKSALEKCALDIDLLRVVAVGLYAHDEQPVVMLPGDTQDEADVLAATWGEYDRIVRQAGGVLVTFNGIGFDAPALIRRSQYLGVRYPRVDMNRYRPGAHIDLQQELSFQGAKPFRSLDFYCRRFGIDTEIPPVGDGADVAAMLAAGDYDGIRAHCLADIRRTQALAQRLGLISAPALAAEEVIA